MIAGIAKFDRVSGAQFQNLVEALADRLYRADGGRDNPHARSRAQCRHDALLTLVGIEPAIPLPGIPSASSSGPRSDSDDSSAGGSAPDGHRPVLGAASPGKASPRLSTPRPELLPDPAARSVPGSGRDMSRGTIPGPSPSSGPGPGLDVGGGKVPGPGFGSGASEGRGAVPVLVGVPVPVLVLIPVLVGVPVPVLVLVPVSALVPVPVLVGVPVPVLVLIPVLVGRGSGSSADSGSGRGSGSGFGSGAGAGSGSGFGSGASEGRGAVPGILPGRGLDTPGPDPGAGPGCTCGRGFGPKAQLCVVMDVPYLATNGERGRCEIPGVGAIARSELQRLGCDSEFYGLLFDQRGLPLYHGRKTRRVSPQQWRVLVARDKGCVICGAHPNWCQAHHVRYWLLGGRTDIDNLVLLCHAHHRWVHDNKIILRRGRNGWYAPTGLPPPGDLVGPSVGSLVLAR